MIQNEKTEIIDKLGDNSYFETFSVNSVFWRLLWDRVLGKEVRALWFSIATMIIAAMLTSVCQEATCSELVTGGPWYSYVPYAIATIAGYMMLKVHAAWWRRLDGSATVTEIYERIGIPAIVIVVLLNVVVETSVLDSVREFSSIALVAVLSIFLSDPKSLVRYSYEQSDEFRNEGKTNAGIGQFFLRNPPRHRSDLIFIQIALVVLIAIVLWRSA